MGKKEAFYITLRRGRGPSTTEKIIVEDDNCWALFHEIENAIILPDVTSFSVRKPRSSVSSPSSTEEATE